MFISMYRVSMELEMAFGVAIYTGVEIYYKVPDKSVKISQCPVLFHDCRTLSDSKHKSYLYAPYRPYKFRLPCFCKKY